jgi:hypothetical protein
LTLKTICDALALDVALPTADSIITNSDREWREVVAMSELVGEELARRVDFGELTNIIDLGDATPPETVAGVLGYSVDTGNTTSTSRGAVYNLGDGFSRISSGLGVTSEGGAIRALSRAEWNNLPAGTIGTPRYFLLEGQHLSLWPKMASGQVTTVSYQSKNWCSSGGQSWVADDDTSLIDESLMTKGLIARWRRQKGMAFEDYEAEYEAALAQIAGFDDRSRL